MPGGVFKGFEPFHGYTWLEKRGFIVERLRKRPYCNSAVVVEAYAYGSRKDTIFPYSEGRGGRLTHVRCLMNSWFGHLCSCATLSTLFAVTTTTFSWKDPMSPIDAVVHRPTRSKKYICSDIGCSRSQTSAFPYPVSIVSPFSLSLFK